MKERKTVFAVGFWMFLLSFPRVFCSGFLVSFLFSQGFLAVSRFLFKGFLGVFHCFPLFSLGFGPGLSHVSPSSACFLGPGT